MQKQPHYFELDRFALIEITGSEAFAFLHRQITGDLTHLASYGCLFSAWCQANGRVICTFLVFKHDQSLFLILPVTMKDKVLRRLNMFVLRSDVRIRDADGDYALLGLHGANILDTDIFGPGARTGKIFKTEVCHVITLPGAQLHSLAVCRKDHLGVCMEKILRVFSKGESAAWTLLDIEAGMSWITETTSETFMPQMLNLDQMQGLSYEKGCYPGQEVIARLHYRGELKRKLFLGMGQGETVPAAGAIVERADTGEHAGYVIDAARHPDGGFRLLAVADINAASAPLRLRDSGQATVKLQLILNLSV